MAKEEGMQMNRIPSAKGTLSLCTFDQGERIGSTSDFLDLMGNCPSDTIVLDRNALAEAFFELRSGLAGEMLQKVSNYRRRLAILGDFDGTGSRALRDFIRESNGTGKVVFAADLEAAVALLK
jgi:hypothetical protein